MATGLVGFARRGFGAALIGLLWLGMTRPLAAQTGGGYDLTWNVMGGGGDKGHDDGGVYSLRGTIGQPAVGVLTGGSYSLTGGFWAVPPGQPADVDGDGFVDVVDLLYFVDSFGWLEGDPAYSPACDFNDDGAVDVVDLLILVEFFGT
jgi:hypothetical protein